jgi:hypothetical protein
MSKERECVLAIRRIAGTGGGRASGGFATYAARVVSVSAAVCTVKRVLDDKEINDVRLNAVIKDSEGLVIAPTVDSYVLITSIDGDKWFVSQFSGIEKITLNVVDTVEVNAGGENLKSVLSDFIDEVAKIIVIQGTTPNVPALNAIKLRLGKILK